MMDERLERCNEILNHSLYQEYIHKNEMAEADRCFCHHDMVHFLDVARLMMILNLKEKLEIPEELIYATALLHDIGRFQQYEDGTGHEIVSGELAPEILQDCGFSEKEITEIIDAIINHRNREIELQKNLKGVLYRADKLSRPCFACKAESDCNWKGDKKNLILKG